MTNDSFLTPPPAPFELTNELRQAILELAQQSDIFSISCPFNDFDLWEGLLKEQVRRSVATGLPLQDALCLCGPDSGISGMSTEYSFPATPDPLTGKFAPDFFGGEVHIPYEGATGGDLFILPEWRNAYPESAIKLKNLSWLSRKNCNYVLTNRDFGEFEFATRTIVAGCYLYKNNAPYVDCHFLKNRFESMAMAFSQSASL